MPIRSAVDEKQLRWQQSQQISALLSRASYESLPG
ncbi:hypothetical protein PSP6_270190 [Paraburkholderia tropica]|nr:hypothetical protein PSP6_270190 [Paraburkholderia tropica]